MTIYRHPVPDHPGEPRLRCKDLEPGGTGECKAKFDATTGKFKCPGLNRTCRSGAFLYPRSNSGDKTHFHQGVDLANAKHGATIVSVTSGRVQHAVVKYQKGVGGYGRTVVIHNEELDLYFLYAHCKDVLVKKGDRVVEQQPIATVGISDTFYNKEEGITVIFDGSKKANSHLHFEVSRSEYFKKANFETRLEHIRSSDEDAKTGRPPREDPLEILEQLGPWGGYDVFLPEKTKVTEETAGKKHEQVHASPTGGYFPLGANNTWHGGVHIATAARAEIVAPVSGTIVALRLGATPSSSLGAFGHANFVLIDCSANIGASSSSLAWSHAIARRTYWPSGRAWALGNSAFSAASSRPTAQSDQHCAEDRADSPGPVDLARNATSAPRRGTRSRHRPHNSGRGGAAPRRRRPARGGCRRPRRSPLACGPGQPGA